MRLWDTSQSALQYIITPVTGFNINPALIVHLLSSLGSILARRHFRGAHMPYQATNNVRILPGTHLYTWVESSNVEIKCLAEGQEVPGIDGNQTRNPLIQSQGFTPIGPIPQHLQKYWFRFMKHIWRTYRLRNLD